MITAERFEMKSNNLKFASVVVPQILFEHPFIELVHLVRRQEIIHFTY
jgi:hypothetical protein